MGYLVKFGGVECVELYETENEQGISYSRFEPLPIFCFFCGESITQFKKRRAKSLVIHSLDGNHDNWNPANKTPVHKGCHTTFHLTGRKHSEETLALLSDIKRNRKLTEETRAKISKALQGKKRGSYRRLHEYPKHRKPPRHHTVKQHSRQGHPVRSFDRGSDVNAS